MWDQSTHMGDPTEGHCRRGDDEGDENLKQSPLAGSNVGSQTHSGHSSLPLHDESLLYAAPSPAFDTDPQVAAPQGWRRQPSLESFVRSTLQPRSLANVQTTPQFTDSMEQHRFLSPGTVSLPVPHFAATALPLNHGVGATVYYPQAPNLVGAPPPHPPTLPVPAVAAAPLASPFPSNIGPAYNGYFVVGPTSQAAPHPQASDAPTHRQYGRPSAALHQHPDPRISAAVPPFPTGCDYHPPLLGGGGAGSWTPAPLLFVPQGERPRWTEWDATALSWDVAHDTAAPDGNNDEEEDCKPAPIDRPPGMPPAPAEPEEATDDEDDAPPAKPARPLSAYNLFFRDERLKLLEQQGQLAAVKQNRGRNQIHSAVGFKEMAQEIARRWRRIDGPTMAQYRQMAGLEMAAYRRRMARFRRWDQAQLEEVRARMDSAVDERTRREYLERFEAKLAKRKQPRDHPPPGPKPPPP